MADSETSKPKQRRIRSAETVGEQIEKGKAQPKPAEKPRRLRKAASVAAKPFKPVQRVREKNYGLPVPDNKVGRFLGKRRHIIPSYFRNSWRELKQVTWPDRKQTAQLTFAVFVFAMVFGILVAVTDYGLDRIFMNFIKVGVTQI